MTGVVRLPVPGGVDGNVNRTRLEVVPVTCMNAIWLPERERTGDNVTVVVAMLPFPVL